MALPVTITGLSTAVPIAGPYKSSAGNFYLFGVDSTTATTCQAYKSTSPSTSWSSIATQSATITVGAIAINNISAVQVGDIIHIAVSVNGSSTGAQPQYYAFNMASDSFTIAETPIGGSFPNTSTSAGVRQDGVAITFRTSDNMPLIFFNTAQAASMGKSYSRVGYVVRTGLNTWSGVTGVDGGGTIDYTNPNCAVGSSSSVHFLYVGSNSSELLERDLNSSNVLGSALTTTGGVLQANLSRTRAIGFVGTTGSTRVAIPLTGNPSSFPKVVEFPTGVSPSFVISSNISITAPEAYPYRLFADGSTVYWIIQLQTSHNWVLYKSVDNCSTFTLVGTIYTSSASQTAQSDLSVDGLIYQSGSNMVIPYVLNDNGTLKYNEYTVRALANYQTGAGSSSGTSTVSGVGASGVKASALGVGAASATGASTASSTASASGIGAASSAGAGLQTISSTGVAGGGGDISWTKQTSLGVKYLYQVASSADGTKLIASDVGYIYTSTDSGVTWTLRTSILPYATWTSLASSDDGTKLAIVNSNTDYVYTSTDSGVTWTQQTGSGSRSWQAIASSADGTKLAAVVYNGNIYTSTDSGVTWTQQTNAPVKQWRSIASSADGTKLIAGNDNGDYIYTSSDSGVTWTRQTGSGTGYWFAVASSADGTKLAIASLVGAAYISTSTDSGVTWTQHTDVGSKQWKSIAISADGTKIVATVNTSQYDYIYMSNDSGATWTPQAAAGYNRWVKTALSSDGTKIVAVTYYDYVYTGARSTVANGVSINGAAATSAGTSTAQSTSAVVISSSGSSSGTSTATGAAGSSASASGTASTAVVGDSIKTIVFRSSSSTTYAVRTDTTLSAPSGLVDDDVIIAAIFVGADTTAPSVIAPAGFTELPGSPTSVTDSGNFNGQLHVYAKRAASESGSYTFTHSSASSQAILLAYAGASKSGLFIDASSHNTGVGVSSDALGITTTQPNDMLIWISHNWTGSGNLSPPVELTERFDGLVYAADIPFASTGATNDVVQSDNGNTGSDPWAAWLIGITPDNGIISFSGNSSGSSSASGDAQSVNAIDGSSSGTSSASAQSAIVRWGQGVALGDGATSWIQRTGSGSWNYIASSDDGTKLAVVNNTFIYTSTDSGVTWTLQSGAGSRFWQWITSSSDGTKLAAVVNNGYIYTSTDSGVTWTEHVVGGDVFAWSSIASSADGTKLVAVAAPGKIWLSTDSGATWFAGTSGSVNLVSVASSADGTKLVAAPSAGYIITSTDSGVTWTSQSGSGSKSWRKVKSSADGTKLIAINNQYVWLSSDSGVTWFNQVATNSISFNANFSSIAISGDGNTVAAAATNDYLYVSNDFGVTWKKRTDIGSKAFWSDITSSYDGKKLAVAIGNDSIYTLTAESFTKDYAVGASTRGVVGTISAGGDYSWDKNNSINYDFFVTSSDGSYLVAYSSTDNSIHTSSDSGVTWTKRQALPSSFSMLVASSDCSKLAASFYSDYIYTSSDYGVTWTQQTGSGSREWYTIASSADGTKLVASEYGGSIYTSSDSGVTWTQQTPFTQYFIVLASSADGTKLIGSDADGTGYLYTSTDSGATWTQRDPGGYSTSSNYWYSVASSADGSVLIAANDANSNNGYGYAYISRDSGATWTELSNLQTMYATAVWVSPDGTKFIVADDGRAGVSDPGKLYTSQDSGITWNLEIISPSDYAQFRYITSSSDLTKIWINDYNALLYAGKKYQAVAAPIASSTASSNGVSSGSGVANPIASATGSSIGTSAVSGDPATIIAGVGASSGSSSASATNLLYSIGHGTASGASSTSIVGASIDSVDASSAGTSSSSFVGRAVTSITASAAGTSTSSFDGESTAASTSSSSGTSSTSFIGNAVTLRTVSSSGTSGVSGVGRSTAASTTSISGTSSASFVGSAVTPAAASASGSASSSVSGGSIDSSAAEATGTSTSDVRAESTAESVASSSGSSSAFAHTHSSGEGDGTSESISTVTGVGGSIVPIIGEASGISTTSAPLVAFIPSTYAVGAGSSTSFVGASIASAVASSDSTSSASASIVAIIEITGSAAGTSDAQSIGTSVLDASYSVVDSSTAQAISGLIQYANGVGTAMCSSSVRAYAAIPPHDFVTIFEAAARSVTVHSSDGLDVAVVKNPISRVAKVRFKQSFE
jgi:photosystem II stability/assembly factor-like uncharacterized protein